MLYLVKILRLDNVIFFLAGPVVVSFQVGSTSALNFTLNPWKPVMDEPVNPHRTSIVVFPVAVATTPSGTVFGAANK